MLLSKFRPVLIFGVANYLLRIFVKFLSISMLCHKLFLLFFSSFALLSFELNVCLIHLTFMLLSAVFGLEAGILCCISVFFDNLWKMVMSPIYNPAGIYLLKNNESNRTICEICSKLTIKAPERRQWRRSGVFC